MTRTHTNQSLPVLSQDTSIFALRVMCVCNNLPFDGSREELFRRLQPSSQSVITPNSSQSTQLAPRRKPQTTRTPPKPRAPTKPTPPSTSKHIFRPQPTGQFHYPGDVSKENVDAIFQFDIQEFNKLFDPKLDRTVLPPRMIYELFQAGKYFLPEEDGQIGRDHWFGAHNVLWDYYVNVPTWQDGILHCLYRLLLRMMCGLDPCPNCSGEEICLYWMARKCKNMRTLHRAERASLISTRKDNDYDEIENSLFDDQDFLVMYMGGDLFCHPRNYFRPFYTASIFNHCYPPNK